MNTFTINGKNYKAKHFNFNTMCDLEEMGVPINEAQSKSMSFVRAYFALHLNGNTAKAGKEIEAHIMNGGDFTEIMNAVSAEIEESDFLKALNKAETETAEESETEMTEDETNED